MEPHDAATDCADECKTSEAGYSLNRQIGAGTRKCYGQGPRRWNQRTRYAKCTETVLLSALLRISLKDRCWVRDLAGPCRCVLAWAITRVCSVLLSWPSVRGQTQRIGCAHPMNM